MTSDQRQWLEMDKGTESMVEQRKCDECLVENRERQW